MGFAPPPPAKCGRGSPPSLGRKWWTSEIGKSPHPLTLTYLGYFASLNSWGGGGGHYGPPPKISTMDGPINLKIGTDTE